MPAIRLIVNADDYGLTPGVSAGIRRAHRHGIVTTTTAMMVFAAVDEDIRVAQSETPALGIGVHLTATEYAPLRPLNTVRSLLDQNGLFRSPAAYYGEHGAEFLAQLDAGELRDEWRTQIERFLVLGVPIDHIDSHHHFAYIPGVPYAVLLELAREYRLPLRQSEREPVPSDIRHPERFISAFYDDQATVAMLLASLANLPDGTTELMCHPGEVDEALMTITSYNTPRAAEITALCDQRVRDEVERRGIQTIQFAGL